MVDSKTLFGVDGEPIEVFWSTKRIEESSKYVGELPEHLHILQFYYLDEQTPEVHRVGKWRHLFCIIDHVPWDYFYVQDHHWLWLVFNFTISN